MSKNNRLLNAVLVFALVAGIVIAPLCLWAVWAWIIVVALLVVLMLFLGAVCTGHLLGVLINERNLMSISRFQAAMWTVIVLASYLVIVVARIRHPGTAAGFNPLDVTIPGELLALVGISATAMVGTPLINTSKINKAPGDDAIGKAATALVSTNNTPKGMEGNKEAVVDTIDKMRQGILYANPTAHDASFWDLFEGDEIGNACYMDLGKVQLFYVTVVMAIAYLYCLLPALAHNASAIQSLPVLPAGLVSLLGISNAGYLGTKAVTQTQTS